MNIYEKLEEIRNKPEHVRERYLWIAVGISMLIIFVAWLISVKMSFQKNYNQETGFDLGKSIENAKTSVQKSAEDAQAIK